MGNSTGREYPDGVPPEIIGLHRHLDDMELRAEQKRATLHQSIGELSSEMRSVRQWIDAHEKERILTMERIFGDGGIKVRVDLLETKTEEIDTHIESTDKTLDAVANRVRGAWSIIVGVPALVGMLWAFLVWAARHLVVAP